MTRMHHVLRTTCFIAAALGFLWAGANPCSARIFTYHSVQSQNGQIPSDVQANLAALGLAPPVPATVTNPNAPATVQTLPANVLTGATTTALPLYYPNAYGLPAGYPLGVGAYSVPYAGYGSYPLAEWPAWSAYSGLAPGVSPTPAALPYYPGVSPGLSAYPTAPWTAPITYPGMMFMRGY